MTSTELVPEDSRRLREITRRIAELRGTAARVLYELGALLVEVEARALWRAGEHPSFAAYLEEALEVSVSTARKAMAVARHFNAGMAERYGIDKLSAGLRYLELTQAVERPGDLVAAQLRLRGAGGRIQTVPFHEASCRQVREAVRALQRRGAVGLPQAERARVERISRALASMGAGRVTVKRRKGGLALSLRDVPLDRLGELAELLLREQDKGGQSG